MLALSLAESAELQARVGHGGWVAPYQLLLAVGISEAGQREILGLDVACGATSPWTRSSSAKRLLGAKVKSFLLLLKSII